MFTIWTAIGECLNPPVVWEAGKDWCTIKFFSEPEVFDSASFLALMSVYDFPFGLKETTA